MDLNLKDKVVIVTGATSGIGEAIARTFAQEGATVVAVGRKEEAGKAREEEFTRLAGKALFVKADLTEEAACKHVVDQTMATFGRLDVLVNNAGINDGQGIEKGLDDFIGSLRKNL